MLLKPMYKNDEYSLEDEALDGNNVSQNFETQST